MEHEIAQAILTNGQILNKAYDDAIHPAAKNIGKAAGTLTSTLDLLLAPIGWAVYGFEIIDQKVKSALNKKFNDTPLDKLKKPDSNIVVPAYEALRCSLDKDSLREMYINLIASSMLEDKKDSVHPAFVEVIKQLSPKDANLLKNIFSNAKIQLPKVRVRLQASNSDSSGVDFLKSLLPNKFYTDSFSHQDCQFSIDNLERLKLIEISDTEIDLTNPVSVALRKNETYENITLPEVFSGNFSLIYPNLHYLNLIKGCISLTTFGLNFIDAVL